MRHLSTKLAVVYSGRRFHRRCPEAMLHCGTEEPAWREVEPAQFTADQLY